MDTVETRERPSSARTVYDGFISYSHAADDLLAPRLQAGLQRFAKPWWKRRALRIFRDESSLSANPHLWSSITDALDGSDWFVLLLSPDAAESAWVNQEVEYWLANKDAERIIPVVTDGEFRWAETDIDLESTAAPPSLYGAFSDEPRWVDLRFARSEEQLDLQNPRFSAGVADIASAIRQVPKDELESEEVRQHRRTVRTAWAAGLVVLLLAVLAGAAALFALDQRGDAQRQAEVSAARELTARAENALDDDPELSAHLALAALSSLDGLGADTTEVVSVLRNAIAAHRVMLRIPGGDFVDVHPDGTLLATSDGDGVAVWDLDTAEVVERYSRPSAVARDAEFSPDGDSIAVAFAESAPAITIWDRASGDSFDLGSDDLDSAERLEFNPEGSLLAFGAFNWGLAAPDYQATQVWEVDEAALLYERLGSGADFNAEGLLTFALASPDGVTSIDVFDPATGVTTASMPTDFHPFYSSWSPSGTMVAASDRVTAVVFDLASQAETSRTAVDRVFRPEWLGDDEFFVGGVGVPKVIDASTGDVRLELRGQAGGTFDYDVVPGTSLVASAGFRTSPAGTVIFETSRLGGVEVGGWLAPIDVNSASAGLTADGSRVFVEDGDSYLLADLLDGANPDLVSGDGVSWFDGSLWFPQLESSGHFIAHDSFGGPWQVRDEATGAVVYQAPEGWSIRGVSTDGAQAVIRDTSTSGFCGLMRLVSTVDGSGVDLVNECGGEAWFSPDGALVGVGNADEHLLTAFFATDSGELVADLGGTPYGGIAGTFSPDSRKFVSGSFDGPVFVLDVETLLSGAPVDEAVDLAIPAHDALVFWVGVSPDGSMVASAALGSPLRVWNLDSGQMIGEFGTAGLDGFYLGDFHPEEPWLLVTSPPNEIRIHTLDTGELIAIAESRLSRAMNAGECEQYFRGPCPES